MKKITFALLLFICKMAVGKDMVKVSGKILNPTADSINISYVLPSIVYKPTVHKMKLGGDGFNTVVVFPVGDFALFYRDEYRL